MRGLLAWLSRLVDVRRGEVRTLTQAFATLLLLLTGHTALETARDALVLTRLPSDELGVVYVAVALCVLPAAGLAARATERLGVRAALGGGLVTAASLLVCLFLLPMTRAGAIAVYVTSGLVGAVLVPLFWNLLGSTFNVAQARRLLGIVGAAGVLGAVLGSTAAAALLALMPVKALLLVSSGTLLVTAAMLLWKPTPEQSPGHVRPEVLPLRRGTAALREEPFLRRIALLVVVSTAAALFLDYFFKWTVVRTVPHAQIAGFVARYYAWLNGLSLLAQLFVTGALVRRVGVATTMVVTPALLMLGGFGALITGGALVAVLVLRAVDGTLRNSVHRVTVELVYLPVPAAARARAKPFIDGALARVTQAVAGLLLLALGSADYLSSTLLGVIVAVAVVTWVVVALQMRGPYLGLLRHAVMGESLSAETDLDPIDLESAETLVEYLAHEDALVVLGAMNVLARRGRERLIPALVLLHEEERVVVRALAIFGASAREDWISRARRLLGDSRESVRTAAARALAMHGCLGAEELAGASGPRLRAYAALHLAMGGSGDPLDDSRIAELLDLQGADGEEARLGLLSVIADMKPDARLSGLLSALVVRAKPTKDWTQGLAKAASSQHAIPMIPELVARLAPSDGRQAVREALVSLGQPAQDYVWAALRDPHRARRVRVHLPNTLARFGTKSAADLLLQTIETERDGLVRYKAIRGLGRIVTKDGLRVDRARVESLAQANLVEHFRLLGLRAPFSSPDAPKAPEGSRRAMTQRLLVGLIDDKLRQSLERTFRLLKIAHPRDDLHKVQLAALSDDSRARANAGEFLDALLRKRDQRALRELLLVVADDLSVPERAARGTALLHGAPGFSAPPESAEQAVATLLTDSDAALASLASLHAATLAGKSARVDIGSGLGERKRVELTTLSTPPAPFAALLRGNHA